VGIAHAAARDSERGIPTITPKLRADFSPRRRYSGLPIEMERDVIALEVLEDLLSEPIAETAQSVGPSTTTEDSTVCPVRFADDFSYSRENMDMGFRARGL
jgi:hypothetical protein